MSHALARPKTKGQRPKDNPVRNVNGALLWSLVFGLRLSVVPLDCIPHVQQDLEIELLASIGKIERYHLRVVASGLGALEGLAIHVVEVGEDSFPCSRHARSLYGAWSEAR